MQAEGSTDVSDAEQALSTTMRTTLTGLRRLQFSAQSRLAQAWARRASGAGPMQALALATSASSAPATLGCSSPPVGIAWLLPVTAPGQPCTLPRGAASRPTPSQRSPSSRLTGVLGRVWLRRALLFLFSRLVRSSADAHTAGSV